jgi:16S rRNA (adenine1518-N6/adenine1519-N6)-dimethyltransferase
LSSHLQGLGPGPAALAEALLIGATDDLTPWEKDSFRLAGCSHVLALSGMHLSLLALALTAVFHRRAPPAAVFIGVQVILALFCFLAGPIPSLWRAWVMAFLGGWWGWTGRFVPLRELLAQSFVVSVLLWPDMAASLSFQLSFLAMAGLFLWGQPWERALRPLAGRWIAANLGASLAAMVSTLPLILGLFGEVRWIGLVMAPPLVFLTTVYLAGGALVALAGPLVDQLPGGKEFLAAAFGALYDAIFACTSWASRFPALGGPVAWIAGIGGLGVASVFLYNRRHRKVSLPIHLNYDSPASLQAFLDQKGYAALKRWGQNFLINAGARKQILDALELVPGEPVWEVGPGLGALTHHLVEAGHPLTVFEIDPGYVAFLAQEFGGAAAGFRVVEGDVVKTWKGQPAVAKVVGNLPYNAASAIIGDFIEGGYFPEAFVVTVQLEMAQRMAAPLGSKNRSSFSILCQSAFTVHDVVTLRPGSFYPAPEVTSRVVKLQAHRRYAGLDYARFSSFVRECYSSRRKTLRNNLPGAASALKVSDERLTAAFASAGVDLGRRAEALSVDEFVAVFRGAAGTLTK